METSPLSPYDLQPDDTLVFLHIPKTGGITLSALIDPMWLPGARCPEYMTLGLARLPRSDLARYRSFIGHFPASALAQLLPGGFRAITMLRQPLSRHLSMLRMLKRIGRYAADEKLFPTLLQLGNPLLIQIFQAGMHAGGAEVLKTWREAPLEALIEDDELQRSQGLINGQTRQLSPLRQIGAGLAGQPELSPSEVGQALLQSACASLDSMLCFGLTERFQESLHMLSFVFGWRPIPNNLRLNEAPETLAADSLPAAALHRLAGCNDLDLELYAHAEKRFAGRYHQLCLHLLERYGDSRQAHLKPPLPAEVMDCLLDRHYRARLLAAQPAVQEARKAVRFTFDMTVSAALGWQRLEVSPQGVPFRWTGPGAEASLDLQPPAGKGSLKVKVTLLAGAAPGMLDHVTLTVNDAPLPCRRTGGAQETTLRATVPAEVVQGSPFIRIGLQTPGTVSPNAGDPENPDTRLLGVAVCAIELSR